MTQGYRLGEFPCNSRANTNEFNAGHERTFTKSTKAFCPKCQVQVSETDTACWRCSEALTPETLDRL